MVGLVCPTCEKTLTELQGKYFCDICGRNWGNIEGIPCFIDKREYWGEIPQGKMLEINLKAKSMGWKYALIENLKKENERIFNYVVSQHRAKFKYLFSDLANASILDIGSGWGTIAIDLAKECKEVTAVERVIERALFAKVWAEQEGIDNLQIIICDAMLIPLPKEYYNYIILNGLLEYIGLYTTNQSPMSAQIDFLAKIRTLLKPGGAVYVGIENRFGEAAWRGGVDHSGLRYTSLMPRILANYYCKLKRTSTYGTYKFTGGYRTYTYSWKGYEKIFKKAGYGSVQIYEVYPAYEEPCIIIPLERANQSKYFYNYILTPNSLKGKIRRLLMRILFGVRMQALLPSHFGIIANK